METIKTEMNFPEVTPKVQYKVGEEYFAEYEDAKKFAKAENNCVYAFGNGYKFKVAEYVNNRELYADKETLFGTFLKKVTL